MNAQIKINKYDLISYKFIVNSVPVPPRLRPPRLTPSKKIELISTIKTINNIFLFGFSCAGLHEALDSQVAKRQSRLLSSPIRSLAARGPLAPAGVGHYSRCVRLQIVTLIVTNVTSFIHKIFSVSLATNSFSASGPGKRMRLAARKIISGATYLQEWME